MDLVQSGLQLYTADQVHLLPGYPSNSSGSLQVAFYVQQPLGLFIGNISVLPRNTLATIITSHKSELETAIGANISGVETLFKPTTPTTSATAVPVEPSSNDWKWIAIGVGVGVVVIILILVFVIWRLKKRDNLRVKPGWGDSPQEKDGGIAMTSYNRDNQAWSMETPTTANFTSIVVASIGSGMISSVGANVTSTPGQSLSSVATPVSLRVSVEEVQSRGLPFSTSVPVHQSPLASCLSKSSPEVAASSTVSCNVSVARNGDLRFTQEPGAKLYVQEGSNAVLKWDYKEDNRTAELMLIIWSVYNKTEKKQVPLIVEYKNGNVQYTNDTLSAYGSRLKKEGRATLVIKDITVEDSTVYRCILLGETGVTVVVSVVELIVTGKALVYKIYVTYPRPPYGISSRKVKNTHTVCCKKPYMYAYM
ncbi:otolith morphogenesis [Desmophyllum pertusum]|uniref:Otolith morphogenesis n=1 Tax=Desmophyllum pertusum TaxID=174260 RepID=A0A9W9ZI15_9CNID|nr:otolith morphogenesis [Desmophyllum pertusum]